MADGTHQVVEVDGRRLKLSNLDKVMYPETGTTKGEVIFYYTEIAPVMVPLVAGRPVTRKRWVNGVGTADAPQQAFFEKNLVEHAPDWLRRGTIHHSDGPKDYPIAGDRATLVWLAQQASLEVHVPQWRFDPQGRPANPDRLVFDLDPGPGVGLPECAEVARMVRVILEGMGLPSVPVTSGSKGMQLYAPLDGSQTSDQASAVAKELARALEADHPDLVVSNMKKTLRDGKVLIDWSQNNANKTTIAPYSLRGRPRPTAAVPRTWDELDDPGLRHLELHEVLERMASMPDPMAAITDASADGPLATYLSMRNASATPEPMPSSAWGAAGDGSRFVIQEHHARRLHYDLRLERDGVLKSWAVPKGVPDDPGVNHLAVQTEDHPMEYATFEGTIPQGEYGAGSMTIWDSGSYETEKWRDDEVIVVLHGSVGGPMGRVRVALIRTEGSGEKSNWLLHRMKDQKDGAPAPVPERAKRDEGTPSGEGPSSRRSAPRSGPEDTSAPVPERAKRDEGTTSGEGPSSRHSAPRSGTEDTPAQVPERAKRDEGTPSGEGPSSRRSAPRSGPADSDTYRGPTAGVRSAEPYRPMLATLGSEALARGDAWAYEFKWDGIRVIARVDDDAVTLTSRNGVDVTATYPELAALPRALRGDAVVDGEIVARDDEGRPSFGMLQQRMNLAKPREIQAAAASVPVELLLFDVLEIAGMPTVDEAYESRRTRLERLVRVRDDVPVHVPAAPAGDLDDALAEARELGVEGLMAKRRRSTYRPGARSDDWLKLKFTRTQSVVIGGYRRGEGTRTGRIRSLLVGIPDVDGLRYIGRVGSGLRERDLDRLKQRLDAIARDDPPFTSVPAADVADAVWVEPELVGEIEFAEWTRSGVTRAPRWRGLRPDAAPADVVLET